MVGKTFTETYADASESKSNVHLAHRVTALSYIKSLSTLIVYGNLVNYIYNNFFFFRYYHWSGCLIVKTPKRLWVLAVLKKKRFSLIRALYASEHGDLFAIYYLRSALPLALLFHLRKLERVLFVPFYKKKNP